MYTYFIMIRLLGFSLSATSIFVVLTSQALGANGISVDDVVLPERLGRIVETWQPSEQPSQGLVLYIQDAHTHPGAQTSIEEILRWLHSQLHVELVGLEGAAGWCDPTPYTQLPNPSRTTQVARAFLEEGIFSGAEYFAISQPEKMRFFGLEKSDIYQEHVRVYLKNSKSKPDIERIIETIRSQLVQQKNGVYPARIQDLDSLKQAYEQGDERDSFKQYLQRLVDIAKQERLLLEAYPNVIAMQEAFELAAALDFKGIDGEFKQFLGVLRPLLTAGELEQLQQLHQQIVDGKKQKKEYYLLAQRFGEAHGIPEYPSLQQYIKYLELPERSRLDKLPEELARLQDSVETACLVTPAQQRLARLLRQSVILDGLFHMKLTRDQWESYQRLKPDLTADRIGADLNFLDIKESPALKHDIEILVDQLPIAEEFYELALRRDEIFFSRIMEQLQGEPAKATVLIAGGFHTGGVVQRLRKNGIAYAVIMPSFKGGLDEARYSRLLADEFPPFRQIAARLNQDSLDAVRALFSDLDPMASIPTTAGSPVELTHSTRAFVLFLQSLHHLEGDQLPEDLLAWTQAMNRPGSAFSRLGITLELSGPNLVLKLSRSNLSISFDLSADPLIATARAGKPLTPNRLRLINQNSGLTWYLEDGDTGRHWYLKLNTKRLLQFECLGYLLAQRIQAPAPEWFMTSLDKIEIPVELAGAWTTYLKSLRINPDDPQHIQALITLDVKEEESPSSSTIASGIEEILVFLALTRAEDFALGHNVALVSPMGVRRYRIYDLTLHEMANNMVSREFTLPANLLIAALADINMQHLDAAISVVETISPNELDQMIARAGLEGQEADLIKLRLLQYRDELRNILRAEVERILVAFSNPRAPSVTPDESFEQAIGKSIDQQEALLVASEMTQLLKNRIQVFLDDIGNSVIVEKITDAAGKITFYRFMTTTGKSAVIGIRNDESKSIEMTGIGVTDAHTPMDVDINEYGENYRILPPALRSDIDPVLIEVIRGRNGEVADKSQEYSGRIAFSFVNPFLSKQDLRAWYARSPIFRHIIDQVGPVLQYQLYGVLRLLPDREVKPGADAFTSAQGHRAFFWSADSFIQPERMPEDQLLALAVHELAQLKLGELPDEDLMAVQPFFHDLIQIIREDPAYASASERDLVEEAIVYTVQAITLGRAQIGQGRITEEIGRVLVSFGLLPQGDTLEQTLRDHLVTEESS